MLKIRRVRNYVGLTDAKSVPHGSLVVSSGAICMIVKERNSDTKRMVSLETGVIWDIRPDESAKVVDGILDVGA